MNFNFGWRRSTLELKVLSFLVGPCMYTLAALGKPTLLNLVLFSGIGAGISLTVVILHEFAHIGAGYILGLCPTSVSIGFLVGRTKIFLGKGFIPYNPKRVIIIYISGPSATLVSGVLAVLLSVQDISTFTRACLLTFTIFSIHTIAATCEPYKRNDLGWATAIYSKYVKVIAKN